MEGSDTLPLEHARPEKPPGLSGTGRLGGTGRSIDPGGTGTGDQRVLVHRTRRDHRGGSGTARASRPGRRDGPGLARLGATTGVCGVSGELEAAFPGLAVDGYL